jgi:membrane protein implicated in regulation of membrane protease activity
MNLWPWWIAVAIALVIAELFSGDLIFLMIAVGTLATALAAYFDVPIVGQVIIGAGVALALLVFVRPLALRTLKPISETVTNTPRLVGLQGFVVEPVDQHDGRIKLDGEVWSARSLDPTRRIEAGVAVEVARIDGATAIVIPKES